MDDGRTGMNIGYVVGALGRGGAELQLLRLSAGMVQRGHRVALIAYDGPSPFDDAFRDAGVDVRAEAGVTGRAHKVAAVRAWSNRVGVDVVHGILRRASTLTLLARWPARRPAVIATDYSSATYGPRSLDLYASLAAFALADRVVTEVEVNRASLVRLAPWLRSKSIVIRNGLDVDRFVPDTGPHRRRDATFVFCVVATLSKVKNPLRVVDAVDELLRRGHSDFRVDWFGRDSLAANDDTGARARAAADARGLSGHVAFLGDTDGIERMYQRSDALLHASLHEGFPNAVAEGMACGLPVVVSRVSDLPRVVDEAQNGFVFDETDPRSIADAMERMMKLPEHDRAAMGRRSRELAIDWFRAERFLDDFETLYASLAPEAR